MKHASSSSSSGSSSGYRGRLAPSPTGQLHLGGAATFLVAWLDAQKAGGELVVRIEDIDQPRVKAGSQEQLLEDLRWLGLTWSEGPEITGDITGDFGPYLQSQRQELYQQAIQVLHHHNRLYLCDCSRAEIARIASAPHPGEEGPVYPGTCRPFGMNKRTFRRPPALRVAVPEQTIIQVHDRVFGNWEQNVSEVVGDFVVRRADGVVGYQLAVVVDDALMKITDVIRGRDLLSSTPRQVLLCKMLGYSVPRYLHTPLVVGVDGQRLAKRAAGVPIADQRRRGTCPEVVLGSLACALGLVEQPRALSLEQLLVEFRVEKLKREDIRVPSELLPPQRASS
jgi:glutamyl-tRNA synthetase